MEAMAAGLPVVVTQTSGTDELVDEGVNGFTFSHGDVKNLTKIIQNLSMDNGMIDEMGTNSRRKAHSFKWEFTVKKYLKLLYSVYDHIRY
jgi:glycosyltransferase involved in cell wall biosynthesis